MSLPYNHKLIPNAKELRKKATPQEKHLWYDFLCSYPVRFQRQKTIDRFIVDFYCHAAKLVVEIDGSQHYTEDGAAYDAERSQLLTQKYDLKVMRFSNRDVDRQFNSVCENIHRTVQARLEMIMDAQLLLPQNRKEIRQLFRCCNNRRKDVEYRHRFLRAELPQGNGICGQMDVFC